MNELQNKPICCLEALAQTVIVPHIDHWLSETDEVQKVVALMV